MPSKTINKEDIEIKKVLCNPSPGRSGCGLIAHVKDGRIVGLRGNPDFPGNRGAVCPKRFPHLVKWLEHPYQLLYPLKRIGKRRENKWERTSWDQALDEIAEKLNKLKAQYGAETLSVIEGTYRSDLYGIRSRFLNLFGNPGNMGTAGTTCGCNRIALSYALAGSNFTNPFTTMFGLDKPGCFVFYGINLPQSWPVTWVQLKKRIKQEPKPKVLVVDPRRTELVDYADLWLQIRPGTDGALLMGWINIIIEEELYDKEFVDKWTFGFEQLKEKLPSEQMKKQLGSDRFKLMTWPAWEIVNEYYKNTYGIPLAMSEHNVCAHEPLIWRSIVYRLQPLGINFKQAACEKYIVFSDEPWTYETINPKTGKPTGFATPSGKFELYSNVLEQLGYDPLPFYEEPPESHVSTPALAKDYPLILTTGGRFLPHFQAENRHFGMGMREQHPDPLMDIHPDTAASLGITDGDWAYIETLRGVIRMRANITNKIHPMVINAEHNWWFPEQPAREPWLGGMWQSNANVLTMDEPDACDPLTGSWSARALLCKVYKVQTS